MSFFWRLARIGVGTAIAASAAAAALADDVAQVGRPAPAFAIQSADDRRLTLHTFARRPLVINVFASWCPPCRRELPGIVAAARTRRTDVAFLGVDEQEPIEIGKRFAGAMRIPYPVGFDAGQFAASYGAAALPETIFIGADGVVSAIVHGPISAADLSRHMASIARVPK